MNNIMININNATEMSDYLGHMRVEVKWLVVWQSGMCILLTMATLIMLYCIIMLWCEWDHGKVEGVGIALGGKKKGISSNESNVCVCVCGHRKPKV